MALDLVRRFVSGLLAAGMLTVSLPASGCGVTQADPPSDSHPAGPRNGSPAPGAGPQKRALIVAIARYAPETLWARIHSDSDVPLIYGALKAQGFPEENIHVLTDAAATRAGIEQAIRQHLIQPAQPGDVLVFHFSGHGQRLTDDDANEETDGYDEALVPYDGPMNPAAGYDGSRHLRDDTVGDLLLEMRRAVTQKEEGAPQGNVVMFFDSCFSGTAARGLYRGGGKPIGPPRNGAAAQDEPGSGLDQPSSVKKLAPYAVLAASRANQVAHEIQEIRDDGTVVNQGSLSYAVSRGLFSLGQGTTYRHLFDLTKTEMRKWLVPNEPQIEGDRDSEIFSGRAVKQERYLHVASVESDGKKVTLEAGSLLGVLRGAEVELHRAGTSRRSPATLLALGKVAGGGLLHSTVTLTSPADPAVLATSGAFVTSRTFGDLRIRVQIRDLGDAGVRQSLLEELGRNKAVEIVDSEPEVIVDLDGPGSSRIIVFAQAGAGIGGPLSKTEPQMAAKVGERLKDFAINRYLSRLDLSTDDLDPRLELVPVVKIACEDDSQPRVETCTFEEVDRTRLTTAGGQLQLPIGSLFKLRIHPGRQSAYLSILDLLPDGRVRVLWSTGGDKFSRDRPWEIRTVWRAGAPAGIEQFKLVASSVPVDFSYFETPPLPGGRRGVRGEMGPFAQLYDVIEDGRRADTAFVAEEVSTYPVTITVVDAGGGR